MLDVDALAAMLAPIVAEEIDKAVAPLQVKIADLEARPLPAPVNVAQLVQEEVAKLPAPENGKDADPEAVASLVAEIVERAVAALPAPQDGKSIVVEDVAPLIAEEVGRAVAALPVPKDGIDGTDGKDGRGVKSLLIDRNGELVATMDDGEVKSLGPIVGKDGTDGEQGEPGFSLDDFDIERGEDGRTFTLKFERGDTRHSYEMTFPAPVYCGVWKEAEEYAPGDLVTWGGSVWHCNQAEPGKPETRDSGWQLMVKKGRDGKDAKVG